MADEQQFVDDGLQRTQIDEFFHEELSRAGYGGMDVAKTPMGTQIVLKAEKPGMVIGKGGKNIRKITTELEEKFDLDDPQIDVQEVEEPDLNAQIVADRLANALERGWYFRKAGHTTIDRIIDAGALGAEIVLSGKVTGARARVEKFNRGHIKHNGEPAEELVDRGTSVAVMKLGTIGVQVRIIPPGAELPDDFRVREDADVEEYVTEPTGDVEELIAGGEAAEDAAGGGAAGGGAAGGGAAGGEAVEDAAGGEATEDAAGGEATEDAAGGDTAAAGSDGDRSDEGAADVEGLDTGELEGEEVVEEEAAEEAEQLMAEMEDVDEASDEGTEDDEEGADR